jgi:hypothetical protein
VRGNSIFANGTAAGDLGIDLDNNGVTFNDTNDVDTGTNGLQNFPVLTSARTSASTTGTTTTINGTLNSSTNGTFQIDFYSSPTVDTSGFGEGQPISAPKKWSSPATTRRSQRSLRTCRCRRDTASPPPRREPEGTSEFSQGIATISTVSIGNASVT